MVLINNTHAGSVDFHSTLGRIFWIDTERHQLLSADLHSPDLHQLILSDAQGVEDFAVDWVHDLLFWTDSIFQSVSVCSLGRY